MNIRSKLRGGERAPEESILQAKRPTGARPDDLLSVKTPRFARRASNHRLADRHRLLNECVRVTWNSADHQVELINLSDGGAMLSGSIEPRLWDRIELHLGPDGTVDCAVCWRRGDRIGLQFAQETRLDCPVDQVAILLRDVITRSFPDIGFELADAPQPEPSPSTPVDESRAAPRHPLIWSGVLHHDYQSTNVRVRNISQTGAMIESPTPVRVATEPLLELSDAVSISATVEWTVGDQVGLRFHSPFDLSLLAQARPNLAGSGWIAPTYLEGTSASAARSPHWRRLDLAEIRGDLEGVIKR